MLDEVVCQLLTTAWKRQLAHIKSGLMCSSFYGDSTRQLIENVLLLQIRSVLNFDIRR